MDGEVNLGRKQKVAVRLVTVAGSQIDKTIAQLKGKKLARIKDAHMMDQLCLEEMLRKAGQEPRGFFELEELLPSVTEAIKATAQSTWPRCRNAVPRFPWVTAATATMAPVAMIG